MPFGDFVARWLLQKMSFTFLSPVDTGRLMARYCIAFETMKRLQDVGDEEAINDVVITSFEITKIIIPNFYPKGNSSKEIKIWIYFFISVLI